LAVLKLLQRLLNRWGRCGGLDRYRSTARGRVGPSVGSDVVDSVGCHLLRVDQDVFRKHAVDADEHTEMRRVSSATISSKLYVDLRA